MHVHCDAYKLDYKYEYYGVMNRLVVTPLTRRAYKEYARAMFQGTAVSAEGPAGTGKTETAKDFYHHLGRFVIVINCSDALEVDAIR